MSPENGGTCQSSAFAGTTSSCARKQQRRPGAPALEAQHEAAPVGRLSHDLSLQARLAEPGVHELRHPGLAAGRVAGVDLDELAQQLAGLSLHLGDHGRLYALDVHAPSSPSPQSCSTRVSGPTEPSDGGTIESPLRPARTSAAGRGLMPRHARDRRDPRRRSPCRRVRMPRAATRGWRGPGPAARPWGSRCASVARRTGAIPGGWRSRPVARLRTRPWPPCSRTPTAARTHALRTPP